MNCREAEHQIFAERDGALETTQRAALASHLDGCAACRRLQQNFAITVEVWRAELTSAKLPDAELEWQKLRREIRGGAGSSRQVRRRHPGWFAIPLAAAAAIAAALFVNHDTETPIETTQSVARAGAKAAEGASTVVFVDEKSGWTFVVAADDPHRG
jgi:anti-sigma factor RsiW